MRLVIQCVVDYEDMVNGKLSEARFQMLSDDYEQEQEDLRAKIAMLEEEIQNQENHVESVDSFIRLAKKHLYLEKRHDLNHAASPKN